MVKVVKFTLQKLNQVFKQFDETDFLHDPYLSKIFSLILPPMIRIFNLLISENYREPLKLPLLLFEKKKKKRRKSIFHNNPSKAP